MKYIIIITLLLGSLQSFAQGEYFILEAGAEGNFMNRNYTNTSFFNKVDEQLGINAIKDIILVENTNTNIYGRIGYDVHFFMLAVNIGLGGVYGKKIGPAIKTRAEARLYPLVVANGMRGYGLETSRLLSFGFAIETDGSANKILAKDVVNNVQGLLFSQITLDWPLFDVYGRLNLDIAKGEGERFKATYFNVGFNMAVEPVVDVFKRIFN